MTDESPSKPERRPAKSAKTGEPARIPRALLVVGVHRSGTSAISGVAELLGCTVPGELVPAAADNPKGFFENRRVVEFHDRLLARLGSAYDDALPLAPEQLAAAIETGAADDLAAILREEFAGAALVLVKDPRMSRLMPVWREAMRLAARRPLVLHPLRHPLDVAASLAKRNDFPQAQGLLLWLDHVLAGERGSRGLPRSFFLYDDLLSDWRSVVAKISADIELIWPRAVRGAETDIDAFLSRDLRHHRSAEEAFATGDPLHALAAAAWDAVRRLVADSGDAGALQALGEVGARLEEGQTLTASFIAASQRTLAARKQRIDDLDKHVEHLDFLLAQAAEARTAALAVQEHQRTQIAKATADAAAAAERARRLATDFEAQREELVAAYETQAREIMAAYEAQAAQMTAAYEAQAAQTTAAYDAQAEQMTAEMARVNEHAARAQSDGAAYQERAASLAAEYEAQAAATVETYEAQARTLVAEYERQAAATVEAYEAQAQTGRETYEAQAQAMSEEVARLSSHAFHLASETARTEREAQQITVAYEEQAHRLMAEIGSLGEDVRRVMGENAVYEARLQATGADMAQAIAGNAHLVSEILAREARIDALLSSASWRATRPIRGLKRAASEPAFRRSLAARLLLRRPPAPPAPVEIAVPDEEPAEEIPAEAPAPMVLHTGAAPDREIAAAGLFDEAFYALCGEARTLGLDPLDHYLKVGEARGYAPSALFDPRYYRTMYTDIARSGMGLLLHYWEHGRFEGRRPRSVAADLDLSAARLDPERQTVLVLSHEASRTGAPILGWNLVRELGRRYNVVVLLGRGGSIEPAFHDAAAAVLCLPDDFLPYEVEGNAVVERLVAAFDFTYAIANSVETRLFIPALEAHSVPVVALVHEFSAYYVPTGMLCTVYESASVVVFPAAVVAQSSIEDYAILRARTYEIAPQGPCIVPPKETEGEEEVPPPDMRALLLKGDDDALLVVGMGTVHIRKGVDAFIAVASEVRRSQPRRKVRFAWIGHGYRPDVDLTYSVYLKDQVHRSGLDDVFVFVDEVGDLEPIYALADLFILTSRLDPLPNVSIDCAMRGIPVVCFEAANGMAELLVAREETRDLVVPYMNSQAAAHLVAALADDEPRLKRLSDAIRARAAELFDMPRYVATIDRFGQDAASRKAVVDRSRAVIAASGILDAKVADRPDLPSPADAGEAAGAYVNRFKLLQPWNRPELGDVLRRPFEGFHPLIYASDNPDFDPTAGEDPLAHFVRTGRPEGRWSHKVVRPPTAGMPGASSLRAAIHGHFHYPELAGDFLARVKGNASAVDLFLSATSTEKVDRLRRAAEEAECPADIRLVPNRGRDIGPFLTEFGQELSGRYEVVGHLHGKRSIQFDPEVGEGWREFLWQHLLGDGVPMIDVILAAFASDPRLGLVFPMDPHLFAWSGNRRAAEPFAERLGIATPLPDYFEFPMGTMFWARPDAIRRVFDLGLTWDDYPEEPLPADGTVLHAIERLFPFAAEERGFRFATTHVPGCIR